MSIVRLQAIGKHCRVVSDDNKTLNLLESALKKEWNITRGKDSLFILNPEKMLPGQYFIVEVENYIKKIDLPADAE